MKSRHVQIVRDSYVHVLFAPDDAARLFYDRLFELAPDTRSLFADDLASQRRLLIDSLTKIVSGLARPDAMAPSLAALAQRHVGYGVEPRHYPIVGEAMLHMIRHVVPIHDELLELAWRDAYSIVSSIMLDSVAPDAPGDDAAVTAPAS